MAKRCIICGKDADFTLKNASGFYCEACAKENFSDLELLERLHERAVAFKRSLE